MHEGHPWVCFPAFALHLNDTLTRLIPRYGQSQPMRGFKFTGSLETYGDTMAEQGSFLGRWWANQHGRQYGITAIAAGSSGVILVLCALQLMFLQDHAEWNDFTGLAITGAVLSSSCFSFPSRNFSGFGVMSTPLKRSRRFNPRLNFGAEKLTALPQPRRWVQVTLNSGMPSSTAKVCDAELEVRSCPTTTRSSHSCLSLPWPWA